MKRILVVEHDSLHRDLIREWLEAGGAEAVCWPSANTAALPADIDAILVDVSCQQEAHGALGPWRQAYPRATIVLVSGRFAAGDNDAMALRLGATRILAKPYSRDDLWAALGLWRKAAIAREQPRP